MDSKEESRWLLPTFSGSSAFVSVLPFGEFFRTVMDFCSDSLFGRFASLAATLYLFRCDPEALKALITKWYRLYVASQSQMQERRYSGALSPLGPFAVDSMTEEYFSNHIFGCLQQCVVKYWSTNWDVQRRIVQANLDYKSYALHSLEAVLNSAEDPLALALEAERMNTPATLPAGLHHVALNNWKDVLHNHCEEGFVLLFHAPFSEFSQETLQLLGNMLQHHQPAPPHKFPFVGCVNCATEVELSREFQIRWYPTIVFKKAEQTVVYPEGGIRTIPALSQWILNEGKTDIHPRKLQKWVTRVLMIKAQNKYATRRKLHNAVMIAQRLQAVPLEPVAPARNDPADPPTCIFLGGGMAAGKTTAVADLMRSDWWKRHGESTVVVNADDFKLQDPLYEAQSPDVHEKSVENANILLCSALNSGRDVIFDGTMMWEPFVLQTIRMVRQCHLKLFKPGEGYQPPLENYWVTAGERKEALPPYRIRLIGIFVDPLTAVSRAILRQLTDGRAVPVQSLLRSFKLFATHFPAYAASVDEVVLFNNNVWIDLDKGQSPSKAVEKCAGKGDLVILDPAAWKSFMRHKSLNEAASGAESLWPEDEEEFTPTPSSDPTSPPTSHKFPAASRDATPQRRTSPAATPPAISLLLPK